MLTRLEIRDFAVISQAVFEPGPGMNVISGETGAGKSLLIDAISIILGRKASKGLIRDQSDEAFVEAVFDISDITDPEFYKLLSESGIDYEDKLLIIMRKVSRDGKSSIRINGRTVILAFLRTVASYLVDIHGQHDTQQIFDTMCHADLLDGFAGEPVSSLKQKYQEELRDYKDLVLEIRSLNVRPEISGSRRKYLEDAVTEITNAGLTSGEAETLAEKRKKNDLAFASVNRLNSADELLTSEDEHGQSVISRIDAAYSEISKIKGYEALAGEIDRLRSFISEVSRKISDEIDNAGYDPVEASEVSSRIDLINSLESKYGGDPLAYLDEAREELDLIDNREKRLKELRKERSVKEAALLKAADDLSQARREAALKLSEGITRQLKDLDIPDSVFSVDFRPRPKERFFSGNGTEDIIFMFSANKGQSPKNLSQTASGGEASRIMLAIKAILSKADTVPTLVFDEIDTGVSGRAALKIAGKLRSIGNDHQVLCVTHTSQLAAAADLNFLISKKDTGDSVSSNIERLSDEGRICEVARLLSGDVTEESVKLAGKLINDLSGNI
ncbi:MAG: DNA repair protein RecN [Clostridiales bacterium]|nr:DNA repair protein RecN [Clostridiales bacterium]